MLGNQEPTDARGQQALATLKMQGAGTSIDLAELAEVMEQVTVESGAARQAVSWIATTLLERVDASRIGEAPTTTGR